MPNKQEIIKEFAQQVTELLPGKVSKVILYGSYARGDYRENSDIDIMVLTPLSDQEISHTEDMLFSLAFDFEMEYSVDISVVMKNEGHFNDWVDTLPFYQNVKEEGVMLYQKCRKTPRFIYRDIRRT